MRGFVRRKARFVCIYSLRAMWWHSHPEGFFFFPKSLLLAQILWGLIIRVTMSVECKLHFQLLSFPWVFLLSIKEFVKGSLFDNREDSCNLEETGNNCLSRGNSWTEKRTTVWLLGGRCHGQHSGQQLALYDFFTHVIGTSVTLVSSVLSFSSTFHQELMEPHALHNSHLADKALLPYVAFHSNLPASADCRILK